jgi:hypothetical protein
MRSKEARIKAARFIKIRRGLLFGGDNFRWVGRGGFRLTIYGPRKHVRKTKG